jgi:hypothetical protein
VPILGYCIEVFVAKGGVLVRGRLLHFEGEQTSLGIRQSEPSPISATFMFVIQAIR